MKIKLIVWAISALIMTALPLSAQESSSDTVKIVYHCDFPDVKRVHFMLNTLNNVVKLYQSTLTDYELNIVAVGGCLQYFMKDFKKTGFVEMPYLTKGGPAENGTTGRFKSLKLLAGDNLKFFACKNTMDKKNVKPEQIQDGVEITPAGVIKVIDLQREGAAYIKIQ